jgi:hypothetical protein
MSVEHGLLLSSQQVHDAPKEKPVLHADPFGNHPDPRPHLNKPIHLLLGVHRPRVTTPETLTIQAKSAEIAARHVLAIMRQSDM